MNYNRCMKNEDEKTQDEQNTHHEIIDKTGDTTKVEDKKEAYNKSNMKYCTECGKAINITDKFCSYCGSPAANNDISNQSDAGKPTKAKADNTPTEPNENSGVHIEEDGIPFKSKDASKPFELDWINEDGSSKNRKVRQSKHNEFEIKQFIWLIILVVSTLLIASQNQYHFWYAVGSVSAMVVKDGLIVAVPIGIFMFATGAKKYHWYHWLNMLAYATVFIRLFFGALNTY